MSDDDSPRLALPLLAPGQAQKEIWHNEALLLLDIAAQATVEEVGRDDPPASPAAGSCWAVGAAPTGDWAGHAGALAGWTGGGWRFVAPRPGLRAWHAPSGHTIVHDGAGWRQGEVRGRRVLIDGQQVVGARGAAVPEPAGGAVIDVQARAAVAQILKILRGHGLIAS